MAELTDRDNIKIDNEGRRSSVAFNSESEIGNRLYSDAASKPPELLLLEETGAGGKTNHPSDSRLGKAQVLLTETAKNILPAAGDALMGTKQEKIPFSKEIFGEEKYIPIPQVLDNAATGVAIGYISSMLLPKAGILGKVGNAVLATTFTAPLVKEGLDVYNEISNAKTIDDYRKAGADLGQALGGFATSLPVGYLGYKMGLAASERDLQRPAMADFGAAKSKFFEQGNDWLADKINSGAELTKKALIGERTYTGSHAVINEFPMMKDSLSRVLEGTDYKLPNVPADPTIGKGTRVAVVTGHGVEAPEYTEVVKHLRNLGAEPVTVGPDWTFQYQPGNEGVLSAAKWLKNDRTIKADIPASQAAKMITAGEFDAVYVPGGAGNTAAIRTDSSILDVVKKSLDCKLDTWTICHGGQVFISAEVLPKGTKLTGSGDIGIDLRNAGFEVPKDTVVFDAQSKLLSGQDPNALGDFLPAITARIKAIQAAKQLKPEH